MSPSSDKVLCRVSIPPCDKLVCRPCFHAVTSADLYRLTLGLIMLGFKGFGFLIALVYNFFSTLSALKEFVLRWAWPYIPGLAKRPEDKFHDVITRVMLQVGAP